MHSNRSVNVHNFAMIPKAEIPRSGFRMQKAYKTALDAGKLVPIYVQEVLPGDTFNLKATLFGRLATPIVPIMDNLHMETFFFFVPNRLVWTNWVKFMGEQDNPADSISYTIPQMVSKASGYDVGSLHDYMGLPTLGQVQAAATYTHSALYLRAYNLIWNKWFRDENLQNSVVQNMGDGPDTYSDFTLMQRGKRHDYFTGALPWPQKGASVSLPLGTSAPVKGIGVVSGTANAAAGSTLVGTQQIIASGTRVWFASGANQVGIVDADNTAGNAGTGAHAPNIYADLSVATAATINQLRQSFQIQKLLERDARGGTRYTEIVRAHFGVVSPDARLQRPEYLGGGSSPITINPIAQTSGTSASGTTTPMGSLSAMGTTLAHGHGFTQSFTEHGMIIGLVCIRADLTYQQGLNRKWSRSTRYDYYFPAFAALGEQTILNKEIYCRGDANDNLAFGYQERWAEYRYDPSEITGLMKSTAASTIDIWHLAQKFTSLPTLNDTFIKDTPPVSRITAVGAAANGQQLLLDIFYDVKTARPMPLYSVPGLIDHF